MIDSLFQLFFQKLPGNALLVFRHFFRCAGGHNFSAANNQLATEDCGDEVEKRGIIYAPDYAVNAGGLMNVSLEIDGYNRERAMRMMRTIYHNLSKIFMIAKRDNIPSYKAADRMAEERIQTIGQLEGGRRGRTARR